MSTAGKVLVALVMLTTLVWLILAAGVAQLNYNGNKAIHDLNEQLAKTQADLDQTRRDIVHFRDETSSIQEKVDRDVAALEARLAGVQMARSQVKENLDSAQYELATVQDTIKASQTALEHRTAEREAEVKALADTKAEVQALMADTTQLASQLKGLREKFQATYRSDVELLGKTR